jgi:hypothetical protein
MELKKIYEPEIAMIKNSVIQELVRRVLDRIALSNPYFFKAAASSSGKYHPPCCNVRGGLARHVKRAVMLGVHFSRAWGFTSRQKDVVVAALILHDIWKNDMRNHAIRAGQEVIDAISADQGCFCQGAMGDLYKIMSCIRHHMGLWTQERIKKPMADYTPEELAVYFADYLSSRPEIRTGLDRFPLEDYDDLEKRV